MKLLTLTILATALNIFVFAQRPISKTTADALNQRMMNGADTVYVVNFWATWCGPCLKELPEFDILQYNYGSKPVKVLLVSMDFPEAYPEKLQKYAASKGILPEIVWFSETDATAFIPKIAKAWSGALPATLIVRASKKAHIFLEKSITAKELMSQIDKLL